MIKLYTERTNIPDSILPPITKYNSNFIYVDNIAECDFVLFPHWEVIYEYTDNQYLNKGLLPNNRQILQDAVERLIIKAKSNSKKSIIFHLSDHSTKINVEDSLIFRASLYKSKQSENEFALPTPKGDLLEKFANGELKIQKKGENPIVGFRGSARIGFPSIFSSFRSSLNITNNFLEYLNISVAKSYQWNDGQILRKIALDKLRKNNKIKSKFSTIIRGYINQSNEKVRALNYSKFAQNIFNTNYTLCLRGLGNYSFRFYETLSAGRIPLFVNTDCVLPLEDIVDWKDYCVWVEKEDINRIDQILLDFHGCLSDSDFEEKQYKIRKLWDEKIKPEAYYGNFHNFLEKKESLFKLPIHSH